MASVCAPHRRVFDSFLRKGKLRTKTSGAVAYLEGKPEDGIAPNLEERRRERCENKSRRVS
jgi:hypothetical protein